MEIAIDWENQVRIKLEEIGFLTNRYGQGIQLEPPFRDAIRKMYDSKSADIRLIREMAHIHFDNKQECSVDWASKRLPHYDVWIESIKFLKQKGFRIFIDKQFEKDCSCLVDNHKWGISRRLRFNTEIYPAGFEITFYQNINRENKNGGEYDFDKYKKMPKSHKIRFNILSTQLIEELCKKFNLKFYDQSVIRFPPLTAEQVIIKHIQECSFDRCNQTSLEETDGYMSDYDFKYNSKSGVKDSIRCGQLRKFKDHNGKIKRGRVYHNINNMWWVVQSKFKHSNIAMFNILEEVTSRNSSRP